MSTCATSGLVARQLKSYLYKKKQKKAFIFTTEESAAQRQTHGDAGAKLDGEVVATLQADEVAEMFGDTVLRLLRVAAPATPYAAYISPFCNYAPIVSRFAYSTSA